MKCENCNTGLSPIVRIAVSGDYYYCSAMCREMHRRTQAAGVALDNRLARDKDGGCYACNGTGLHEAIPDTKKWCEYCGGTGKRRGLEIPQISVLSAEDRKTIEEARRWIRYLWQQGLHIDIDGIEHDCLFDLLKKLDSMHARHSGEPQLAEGKR